MPLKGSKKNAQAKKPLSKSQPQIHNPAKKFIPMKRALKSMSQPHPRVTQKLQLTTEEVDWVFWEAINSSPLPTPPHTKFSWILFSSLISTFHSKIHKQANTVPLEDEDSKNEEEEDFEKQGSKEGGVFNSAGENIENKYPEQYGKEDFEQHEKEDLKKDNNEDEEKEDQNTIISWSQGDNP